MNSPRTKDQSSKLRFVLYAILIAAVVLRFYALNSQSLWLDELWAIEVACGHDADHQLLPVNQILIHPPDLTSLASAAPPWRIWTSMDRITSPPDYHFSLRAWMTLFGQSETSLRSLSIVFSILGLVIFFLLLRSSSGAEPALWAAAIFAFSQAQTLPAQDSRPYAMLIFETAFAVSLVLKISATGPSTGRTVALIACLFSLVFTHYFAISVLVAIGIFAVLCASGRARRNILFDVIIASALFIILWGPMIWRQIPLFSTNDRAAAFLHDAASDHIRQTFWRFLTMPMSLICDIKPIPRWYAIGGVWYALTIFLLIRRKLNPIWPILYLSITGFLATLDLLHSTAHLSFIRYPLCASVAVYAVLAATIAFHRNLGRVLCASAVMFCLFCLPRAYSQTNEDFRGFGDSIRASTQSGDLIVFAGPAKTYSPQILYLAASHYAWPLPGPVLLTESPVTPQLMAQLNSRKTIWLAADPTVLLAREWLPGYHLVAGKSWPEVGSLLEMHRDP